MPSFALYPQTELNNILDFVTLLSIRGETERFVADDAKSGSDISKETVTENSTVIARNWTAAETKVVSPKIGRPATENREAFTESIQRGKELFLSQKVQCFNCHGKQGRGDGLETDPKKTTDSWGNPSKPADLTLGVFRGGGRPLDLFRRIHDGIKGTPMPAQANNLKEEDIWDLVNYLRTLAYEDTDRVVAQSSTKGHESKATEN